MKYLICLFVCEIVEETHIQYLNKYILTKNKIIYSIFIKKYEINKNSVS